METRTGSTEAVFVPRVIGLPVEQAKERLRDVNLRWKAQSPSSGPSVVRHQNPPAGTEVASGSTVILDLHNGDALR